MANAKKVLSILTAVVLPENIQIVPASFSLRLSPKPARFLRPPFVLDAERKTLYMRRQLLLVSRSSHSASKCSNHVHRANIEPPSSHPTFAPNLQNPSTLLHLPRVRPINLSSLTAKKAIGLQLVVSIVCTRTQHQVSNTKIRTLEFVVRLLR